MAKNLTSMYKNQQRRMSVYLERTRCMPNVLKAYEHTLTYVDAMLQCEYTLTTYFKNRDVSLKIFKVKGR